MSKKPPKGPDAPSRPKKPRKPGKGKVTEGKAPEAEAPPADNAAAPDEDGNVIDFAAKRDEKAKAKGGGRAKKPPIPSILPVPPMPNPNDLHADAPEHVERPNALGRKPAILPTRDVLNRLTHYNMFQLTREEAASCFGVSRETFRKFLDTYPEALEAFEMGEQLGKVSVKRAQFIQAHTNPVSAIWWGKNNLGQSDKIEQKATVTETSTTTVVMDANAEIKALCDRVGIRALTDAPTTH